MGWRRLTVGLFALWLLVLPTFALPAVDLSGDLARAAYWASEIGGPYGLPALALLFVALTISRPGLGRRERALDSLALIGALLLFLAGGAWFNEHVLKPAFAIPRPNLVELGSAGLLGLSPEAFYGLGDKAARSAWLAGHLGDVPGVCAEVRDHWVVETGFSFPSGHSFSSFLFATFFLGLAFRMLEGKRRLALLLAAPLALAVCYARPILRVHSPTDVTVGSVQGLLLGLMALWSYDRVTRRAPPVQDAEPDPSLLDAG